MAGSPAGSRGRIISGFIVLVLKGLAVVGDFDKSAGKKFQYLTWVLLNILSNQRSFPGFPWIRLLVLAKFGDTAFQVIHVY